MQKCPQCLNTVLDEQNECNNCQFSMEKTICPSCSSVISIGLDLCDSCGQYLSRELVVISNNKLTDNKVLSARYLVLDSSQNIVKDTKPNFQTFYSNPVVDVELLNKYKSLAKYNSTPQIYDSFNYESNDYIIIYPTKDNYGQDLRTINEIWSELTEREKLQLLREWANLYQDFEKNKVVSSLLDHYNICVDQNLNLKIKLLKSDNDTSITLKNLGEAWSKLIFSPGVSFLEYSKYKMGEIVRNINEGKITDINELIKKLDTILENPVTDLLHSALTHPGKKRKNNEDNFYASTLDFRDQGINTTYRGKKGLYIVCDGMGGHESGEVASAKAVSETRAALLPSLCFSLGQEDISELIKSAIVNQANESIFQLNEKQNRKSEKRMGTTIVTAMVLDDKVYVAHVGDSRIYMVTKNSIEQVTEDHNIAMKNYRSGLGTLQEAMNTASTAWGKVLAQVLGPRGADSVEPDINMFNLKEESYFILCSDGLTDMVKNDKIHQIILDNWQEPNIVTNKLIEAANNNGGHDNITVVSVLVKLKPALFPPYDYAEVFFNNELKVHDEIVEMVDINESSLEGLNVDPEK
ncbi:MAG: protein phosphatase 2C domain-containing protein [Candidatus Sericytochromatia bacterium]|nr:protein phosphatase 2C domain-containing protein [Candidatus Sericytochromatia bacterium]